jgi:hypothetical protein
LLDDANAAAQRTTLGLGTLATNNTLIESGTFTPDLDFITAPTYNSRSGRYVRVGERMFVEIMMDFASLDNTDSSNFTISGLPYSVQNAPQSGSVDPVISTLFSGLASIVVPSRVLAAVATRLQLARSSGVINYNTSGVASAGVLWVQATVRV